MRGDPALLLTLLFLPPVCFLFFFFFFSSCLFLPAYLLSLLTVYICGFPSQDHTYRQPLRSAYTTHQLVFPVSYRSNNNVPHIRRLRESRCPDGSRAVPRRTTPVDQRASSHDSTGVYIMSTSQGTFLPLTVRYKESS